MKLKRFIINWQKNEKYNSPVVRTVMIEAAHPADASAVFTKNFGNLKKNTINFIQEIDEKGEPVGEKIIPE